MSRGVWLAVALVAPCVALLTAGWGVTAWLAGQPSPVVEAMDRAVRDDPEVIVLGNSMSRMAVDREALQRGLGGEARVAVLTVDGSPPATWRTVFEQRVVAAGHHPERVILPTVPAFALRGPPHDALGRAHLEEQLAAGELPAWAKLRAVRIRLRRLLQAGAGRVATGLDADGVARAWEDVRLEGGASTPRVSAQDPSSLSFEGSDLRALAEAVVASGAELWLVRLPVGPHSPVDGGPAEEERALTTWATSTPGVHWLDLSELPVGPDGFVDQVHLAPAGRQRVTAAILARMREGRPASPPPLDVVGHVTVLGEPPPPDEAARRLSARWSVPVADAQREDLPRTAARWVWPGAVLEVSFEDLAPGQTLAMGWVSERPDAVQVRIGGSPADVQVRGGVGVARAPAGPLELSVPSDGPWTLVRSVRLEGPGGHANVFGRPEGLQAPPLSLLDHPEAEIRRPAPVVVATSERVVWGEDGVGAWQDPALGAMSDVARFGRHQGLGCSPFAVLEDGVPLPRAGVPESMLERGTPGAWAADAHGVRFRGADPGRARQATHALALVSDLPAPRCPDEWVHRGGRWQVSVPVEGGLDAGADTLVLATEVFGTGTVRVRLQVDGQVVVDEPASGAERVSVWRWPAPVPPGAETVDLALEVDAQGPSVLLRFANLTTETWP